MTSNQAGWGLGAALGGLAFGWIGYPGLSALIVAFALLGAGLVLRLAPEAAPALTPAEPG